MAMHAEQLWDSLKRYRAIRAAISSHRELPRMAALHAQFAQGRAMTMGSMQNNSRKDQLAKSAAVHAKFAKRRKSTEDRCKQQK